MSTAGTRLFAPAPVAIALDGLAEPDALALARALSGRVWGFKLNDLLLRGGAEIVPRLKRYGGVFCDPKLHDIPNTVANQVRALAEAGADLVTLHASGGLAMLRAARRACPSGTRLLGVTVLTAMPEDDVRRVYGRDTAAVAEALMRVACEAGLDGVVCSPLELALADRADPARRLLRVTPGVRPAKGAPVQGDDQQRVQTPAEALKQGANLLVIGRPITAARDPVAAANIVLAELGQA